MGGHAPFPKLTCSSTLSVHDANNTPGKNEQTFKGQELSLNRIRPDLYKFYFKMSLDGPLNILDFLNFCICKWYLGHNFSYTNSISKSLPLFLNYYKIFTYQKKKFLINPVNKTALKFKYTTKNKQKSRKLSSSMMNAKNTINNVSANKKHPINCFA